MIGRGYKKKAAPIARPLSMDVVHHRLDANATLTGGDDADAPRFAFAGFEFGAADGVVEEAGGGDTLRGQAVAAVEDVLAAHQYFSQLGADWSTHLPKVTAKKISP